MKLGLLLSFTLGASAVPAAPGDSGGIVFGRAGVFVDRPSRLGAANSNCANMHKLADGISHNIAIQRQALISVARLRAAAGSTNGAFAAAKSALLDNINAMVQVREANQQIAGAPEAVIKGLQTVAEKQAQEKALTESLSGTSADLGTIDTLNTLFTNGIALNQRNAQEVSCRPMPP